MSVWSFGIFTSSFGILRVHSHLILGAVNERGRFKSLTVAKEKVERRTLSSQKNSERIENL
jgi:hypothetical protein